MEITHMHARSHTHTNTHTSSPPPSPFTPSCSSFYCCMRHQTALIKDLITSILTFLLQNLNSWGSGSSQWKESSRKPLVLDARKSEKLSNRLAMKLIFHFLHRGRLSAPVPPGFGFVNIKLPSEPSKCHIGICLDDESLSSERQTSANHAFFSRVSAERETPQVSRCPICYWRSVEK